MNKCLGRCRTETDVMLCSWHSKRITIRKRQVPLTLYVCRVSNPRRHLAILNIKNTSRCSNQLAQRGLAVSSSSERFLDSYTSGDADSRPVCPLVPAGKLIHKADGGEGHSERG